jgi:SSS family solute:Na+ symporter
MIVGGGTTLGLILSGMNLPLGLDANVFGISTSVVTFVLVSMLTSVNTENINNAV